MFSRKSNFAFCLLVILIRSMVDRMFSVIHQKIKVRNMCTLEDLHRACMDAYTESKTIISCHHLDEMGYYSVWMHKYLEAPTGITNPRCFLFKRNDEGQVRHWYRQQLQTRKQSRSGDVWFPANEDGLPMWRDDAFLADVTLQVLNRVDCIFTSGRLGSGSHAVEAYHSC